MCDWSFFSFTNCRHSFIKWDKMRQSLPKKFDCWCLICVQSSWLIKFFAKNKGRILVPKFHNCSKSMSKYIKIHNLVNFLATKKFCTNLESSFQGQFDSYKMWMITIQANERSGMQKLSTGNLPLLVLET